MFRDFSEGVVFARCTVHRYQSVSRRFSHNNLIPFVGNYTPKSRNIYKAMKKKEQQHETKRTKNLIKVRRKMSNTYHVAKKS